RWRSSTPTPACGPGWRSSSVRTATSSPTRKWPPWPSTSRAPGRWWSSSGRAWPTGRAWPEVGAILVATELSTNLLQQALRSGVRDVLGAPTEATSLAESVERVARTLTMVPTVPTSADDVGQLGRVITVSSTKGGSGKSVVATNLATALARRSSRPVVLVDADLQFGDVAVMLRLVTPHTLVDAVSAGSRLDAQLLQSLLVRHNPSGLLVLPAPLEPSFAERVTGADMTRIIEVLRSFC